MLSNRPATPFRKSDSYPPSLIIHTEIPLSSTASSPVLGEENKESAPEDNSNNIHNTPPSKLRLPSRLPSIGTPRGGSFRSISERVGHDRPTFETSRGPVPAVFRNKRIDMNRLKNIDLDQAFGPSKRRSISGSAPNFALLAERGASMMSGLRGTPQSDYLHKRLSCSVNGRS